MANTHLRSRWILAALVSGVVFNSCATDRLENVSLSPPAVSDANPAVVGDADVKRVLEIVDEVATQFEFRRIAFSPVAQQVQDDSMKRLGLIGLAKYERAQAPGAFVVMQVVRAMDGSHFVVATRTLRGGAAKAAAFLVDVRDAVAAGLREAFPDWKVETESGTIDATLAP